MTYADWCITFQNRAVLVINDDLQLLHAISAVSEQRREHLRELVTDGQHTALEGDLSILDVGDASRGARDEFMADLLQLGEGSISS